IAAAADADHFDASVVAGFFVKADAEFVVFFAHGQLLGKISSQFPVLSFQSQSKPNPTSASRATITRLSWRTLLSCANSSRRPAGRGRFSPGGRSTPSLERLRILARPGARASSPWPSARQGVLLFAAPTQL